MSQNANGRTQPRGRPPSIPGLLSGDPSWAEKILDFAGVILVVLDTRGQVVFVNQKGCDFLGWRRNEVVERDWFELAIPRQERLSARRRFSDLLTGRSEAGYWESSVRLANGSRRIICWRDRVLSSPGGQVEGVISSGVDVTDRFENNDLWRAGHQASLSEIAASVAHEIKNPIAAISGVLQILQENPRGLEDQPGILGELNDRLRKLDRIARRLLRFAGPWRPELQSLDLREVVRYVIDTARKNERFSGIRFEMPEQADVIVALDLTLAEEVLWNLLDNAREAMPDGGRIDFLIQKGREAACLVIRDDGPGFSEEVAMGLFRPFFTTKQSGSGLGLAICRKIMLAQGGSIQAGESEVGGAEFRLCFALAQPSPGAPGGGGLE